MVKIIAIVFGLLTFALFLFLLHFVFNRILPLKETIECVPLLNNQLEVKKDMVVDFYGRAEHIDTLSEKPVAYKQLTSQSGSKTFSSAKMNKVPYFVVLDDGTRIKVDLINMRLDLDRGLPRLDPNIEFDNKPYSFSINPSKKFLYRGTINSLDPLAANDVSVIGSVPKSKLFETYLFDGDFMFYAGIGTLIFLVMGFGSIHYFRALRLSDEELREFLNKKNR